MQAFSRRRRTGTAPMRVLLVVLVLAFAGLLAVDLRAVVAAPRSGRRLRTGGDAEAGTRDRRGRIRQERLGRSCPARRSQGRDAGRGRACESSPKARRRPSGAVEFALRCPRAHDSARCAPTRRRGSRASRARRSVEGRPRRSACGSGRSLRRSAPHGDRDSAAIATEGRFVTTLRLGVRPGPWRAESRGERLSLRRRVACRSGSAQLGYLDRRDVAGGRLPHRAGAPRVPGLGGARSDRRR